MPASAYPIPYTLLSLPRFARMVGIAPLHFAGATAASINPQVFPTGTACGDVWPRYDWQKADQVSHESLAYAIKDAEETLAREVGYWAAPTWITKEQAMFPRDFYRTVINQTREVRGFGKSVNTQYSKIISGGQRGALFIDNPRVNYTDEDGDGLYETATVTIVGVTASTDACDFHVFFEDMDGDEDWEVRPLRTSTLVAGTLTIVLDSWLLIDPDLLAVYPTDDGFTAVDTSTVVNFVANVDVYYIYNDHSGASAVFAWENATPGCICSCGGTGCEVCSDTTQDGCIAVRDPETGIVAPFPATYSDGTWTVAAFDVCRAPDRVELYYYAGERDKKFLRGASCDPLSDYWAWCIIWLAIARLERPPCSCNRLKNMFDYLREDLSMSSQGRAFFSGEDLRTNPLGTHRGEYMAWKRIKHHTGRRMRPAVI